MKHHLSNMKITHKQLQSQLEDLFKLFGYKYYFTWKSYHSPPGYPDYTATRGNRTIWVELKTVGDKLKPAQEEWHRVLKENPNNEVYLIYPDDIESLAKILK